MKEETINEAVVFFGMLVIVTLLPTSNCWILKEGALQCKCMITVDKIVEGK